MIDEKLHLVNKFKEFLKDKHLWVDWQYMIAEPKLNGSISTSGNLNWFFSNTPPGMWVNAFNFKKTLEESKWNDAAREWMHIISGKEQPKKVSDFIKTKDGITTFEKDGVHAELNLSSDKLSFFVDIEPDRIYSRSEIVQYSYKTDLENAIKFFSKMINELK